MKRRLILIGSVLLLAIITFLLVGCTEYKINYKTTVEGRVSSITEGEGYFDLILENQDERITFLWSPGKKIPFEVGKAYRIKFGTQERIWWAATLLEYTELEVGK